MEFLVQSFGEAGNALAAIDVPPKDTCGTKVQLYLAENHPTPSDGVVTRKVCAASGHNNCKHRKNIQVINCGVFYLYKLVKFKHKCSPEPWRYCTNGEAGEYWKFI